MTQLTRAGRHGNEKPRNTPKYSGPVNLTSAARSVYDGRDRLGSYRCCAGRWIAVDRLSRPLGSYDTEIEARAAISAVAP